MFQTRVDRLLAGAVAGGLAFLGLGELFTRLSEPGSLVYWLPTLWGGAALILIGSHRRNLPRRTSQILIVVGVALGFLPSMWTLVLPALSIALVLRTLMGSDAPEPPAETWADENKQLLASYIAQVWDDADVNAIRSFLSPTFRRHLSPHLPPLDVDGQVDRILGFRLAFPDLKIAVQDVVAEGDRVVFRAIMRGTHLGQFRGVSPTGRHVVFELIDIIRIENGLFMEQWGGPDIADLLSQLEFDTEVPDSGQ